VKVKYFKYCGDVAKVCKKRKMELFHGFRFFVMIMLQCAIMQQEFENNAIFWVEVDKIQPNPYQPRKEFNEAHLRDLSDSIRQYGVLQPLVVTRKETPRPDGTGMDVSYELIAGERRLRASKLGGIARVPVLIRQGAEDAQVKLELAIIENLQREDLNPVDRALAFAKLANEFGFKHTEIAKKVGKSREYVSNTLRLLVLPQDILDALSQGKITEGHARPLMMLSDRPEEQSTLFKARGRDIITCQQSLYFVSRGLLHRDKKHERIGKAGWRRVCDIFVGNRV
jgi:ParB family chromosome partitioning protein